MKNLRFLIWILTLPLSVILLHHSEILSALFIAFFIVGCIDLIQNSHSILRNYPLIGHCRFLLEYIRPEIRQYFLENDEDNVPFSRNQRSLVYSRAKLQNDKRGFGSNKNVYDQDTEWLCQSIIPKHADHNTFRISIGGPECSEPYSASIFNISAMSFGALSANAIRALNKGAKLGNFAHDTGEGSLSPYHLEFGGDIIWEIGSGYFGCRTAEGKFCPEQFSLKSKNSQVQMIEIKISQGAKPGHGGVLPATKVSSEIAFTRGVPVNVDCVSPAAHQAFTTPLELMEFIALLRKLSDGKPIGFKLCIGQPWDLFGIAKAMIETAIYPDFIVVDGSEGGTGAAPVEFTDNVGMPLRDGLRLVHNTLVGISIRDRIKIGASGKIISAFDIVRAIALGADWCNSARGFMFALGCIQSRTCHTDFCPTGIATQDSFRQRGLVVNDKATRVKNYHEKTLEALAEMIGAAGLVHPKEINPFLIMTRKKSGVATSLFNQIPTLDSGILLNQQINTNSLPEPFHSYWTRSAVNQFGLS